MQIQGWLSFIVHLECRGFTGLQGLFGLPKPKPKRLLCAPTKSVERVLEKCRVHKCRLYTLSSNMICLYNAVCHLLSGLIKFSTIRIIPIARVWVQVQQSLELQQIVAPWITDQNGKMQPLSQQWTAVQNTFIWHILRNTVLIFCTRWRHQHITTQIWKALMSTGKYKYWMSGIVADNASSVSLLFLLLLCLV